MKFYKFVGLIIGITVLSTACKPNLLNVTNPNAQTTQTFWKTSQDAVRGTNAIYEVLQLDGGYMRFSNTVPDLRADDTKADSPWIEMTDTGDFSMPATSLGAQLIWKVYYEGIYRANQVIENVPGIKMDANLKARLLGEAHFLRGLYYFNLVKYYHNVPLVLHTVKSQKDYLVSQAPADSVWMQIESDFKAAIPVLPLKYSGNDIGRATKGAAEAYLGKAYLFNKQWQDAANEFKKVIDSGVYGLVANYRDNFTSTDENNKESIFEVQFSRNVGGTVIGWQSPPYPDWGQTQARSITYAPTNFGWADIEPTRILYDEFRKDTTVTGGVDPRLKASLFYDYPGETVYGVPYKKEYPGADSTQIFWRKYESDTPGGNEFDARSGINIRLMRYADVLMMYAEAENDLGNTNTAYTYVQMVRARADLPDLKTVMPNMDKQQMQDEIAHERFLEFCGEGHRFDDIVRWGWLNDPTKLAWLRQRDPEFDGYVKGREYLPIPQSELDVNPKLKQNPGY